MVHEDEAVHLRRECRIVLHVQRLFGNALDVVHTAGFRADVDHVHEHFARGAGLIRRAEFFETRVVNAAHLGVGGETARAGNDALRRTDVEFLAADFDFHARHAAFERMFAVNAENLGVRAQIHADALGFGREHLDVGLAARTERIAAARIDAAVDLIDVVLELDAALLEPGHRLGRAFRQNPDEFGVGPEVARRKRLFGVKFRRILDAGLFVVFLDRSVEAAARDDRVAAGEAHLFEKQRLRARFLGDDGGGETGTARTDDDHVEGFIPFGGSLAEVRCLRGAGKAGRNRRGGTRKQMTTGNGHDVSPFLHVKTLSLCPARADSSSAFLSTVFPAHRRQDNRATSVS